MGPECHKFLSRKKYSLPVVLGIAMVSWSPVFVSSPTFAQALGPFFGIDNEVEAPPERIKLLPDDFFDSFPTVRAQNIGVEADNLIFDAVMLMPIELLPRVMCA